MTKAYTFIFEFELLGKATCRKNGTGYYDKMVVRLLSVISLSCKSCTISDGRQVAAYNYRLGVLALRTPVNVKFKVGCTSLK